MLALNIPDELTLDHVWRDKKREYSFDAVFSPDASQGQGALVVLPSAVCIAAHPATQTIDAFSNRQR